MDEDDIKALLIWVTGIVLALGYINREFIFTSVAGILG